MALPSSVRGPVEWAAFSIFRLMMTLLVAMIFTSKNVSGARLVLGVCARGSFRMSLAGFSVACGFGELRAVLEISVDSKGDWGGKYFLFCCDRANRVV